MNKIIEQRKKLDEWFEKVEIALQENYEAVVKITTQTTKKSVTNE